MPGVAAIPFIPAARQRVAHPRSHRGLAIQAVGAVFAPPQSVPALEQSMKWILRFLLVAVLAILAIVAYALATARGSEHPVGFQTGQTRDAQGRVLPLGIWYPTSASPRPTTLIGALLLDVAPDGPVQGQALPLVLISHGNGAGLASHADLAMDLASAGFVVVAPLHAGDNAFDQSAAASARLFSDRAQQLSASLDYMLQQWPGRDRIDPARIGAFGFSAGAFALLTLIGAQADMAVIPAHCAQQPEFICRVLQAVGSELLATPPLDSGSVVADPRLRAAVIAAPGLGFTFTSGSFAEVAVPVQLWSGDQDDTVPYASNAGIVRAGLGSRVEFHAVPAARHMSFLAPCGLLSPPALCADAADFDRAAFHADMNAQVIDFFGRQMPAR